MALGTLHSEGVPSALPDETALELGAHHVGHHLALRRYGIDAEVQGDEAPAGLRGVRKVTTPGTAPS